MEPVFASPTTTRTPNTPERGLILFSMVGYLSAPLPTVLLARRDNKEQKR
jgi:hypothetical protein